MVRSTETKQRAGMLRHVAATTRDEPITGSRVHEEESPVLNLRCGFEPRSLRGDVLPRAERVLACDDALSLGLRDFFDRSSPGASGNSLGTVPYVRAPHTRSFPRNAEGCGIRISFPSHLDSFRSPYSGQ